MIFTADISVFFQLFKKPYIPLSFYICAFSFLSLCSSLFLSSWPFFYPSYPTLIIHLHVSSPTIQTLLRPTISTPASSPVVSKSTKITFAKEPEELENVAIIERRHRQRSQHTSNADVDDDKKDRLKDDVGQETTEDKEAEDDEGEGWVEASAERKHRGKGATFKKRWLRTKSLVS